jgi:hypothetical protein
VAVMIFVLPSFQTMVAWTGVCFHPFAVALSLWAIYNADKIPLDGHLFRRITSRYGLMAILAVICAHMVYQSTATFYWAMAAILIILDSTKNWDTYRKRLINIYSAGILGIGIYGLIFKIVGVLCKIKIATPYEPQKTTHDIIGKFSWFSQEVIPQALNLWSILPSKKIFLSLLIFLVGAFILESIRSRRISLVNVTIAVTLLLLSFLPNLLAVVNLNATRCAAGLTALCLISLIWGLNVYLNYIPQPIRSYLLTSILGLTCFYAVTTSYFNIDTFRARPSHLEYTFLKDAINSRQEKMKGVYIIQIGFDDFYRYYDEFGVLTSSWNWDIIPMFNCVMNEIAIEEGMEWRGVRLDPSNEVLLTYIFRDKNLQYYRLDLYLFANYERPPNLSDSILVIDMKSLYPAIRQTMGKHFDDKPIY